MFPRVDDEHADDKQEHIQIWDAPPELRQRIKVAAAEHGVSMSRYLIDVLDPLVPPLPER